jgi:hypothetical protein
MPNLTLADIENTAFGKQIIAERDAQAQAEVDETNAKRQAQVDTWQAELSEVATRYTGLRTSVLAALGDVAATTQVLSELRQRLNALRGYIVKNHGEAADFPAPLADRKAFLTARAVVIGLLGPAL